MSWNAPLLSIPTAGAVWQSLPTSPGFSAPLPFGEPDAPLVSSPLSSALSSALSSSLPASLTRLLKGPFVMDGDLVDVMPGNEAIVLVSPRGDKIVMQNEGRVTFHVPAGWRILVGSKPLRSDGVVKRFVRVGDSVEEVEGTRSMLCLDNIPDLYSEAEPFGPRR